MGNSKIPCNKWLLYGTEGTTGTALAIPSEVYNANEILVVCTGVQCLLEMNNIASDSNGNRTGQSGSYAPNIQYYARLTVSYQSSDHTITVSFSNYNGIQTSVPFKVYYRYF